MQRRAGPLLALAASLLWAWGCGLTRAAAPAELRVMTYNIHYGDPDLGRIAAVICGSGADIVGLQEVDVHWSARSGFADQAAEIARLCGMQFRYAPIYTLPPLEDEKPPRQFGVAVLSRLPIVASRTTQCCGCPRNPSRPAPSRCRVFSRRRSMQEGSACKYSSRTSIIGRTRRYARRR